MAAEIITLHPHLVTPETIIDTLKESVDTIDILLVVGIRKSGDTFTGFNAMSAMEIALLSKMVDVIALDQASNHVDLEGLTN